MKLTPFPVSHHNEKGFICLILRDFAYDLAHIKVFLPLFTVSLSSNFAIIGVIL